MDKGAYEEAARVKGADGLVIALVTVADLLQGRLSRVRPRLLTPAYRVPGCTT